MDHTKIGKLIYTLRKEKGLTQLQLAEAMHISDKTVSKWERGLGCPDISLLCELSKILNVDLSELLRGQLTSNDILGGSMKRIKFYVCPNCGNILTALSDTAISCCGKKLLPLELKKADAADRLSVEIIENEFFISANPEMTKEHYISFIAYVTSDRFELVKLYPEGNAETRFARRDHGFIYYCCNRHGLMKKKI